MRPRLLIGIWVILLVLLGVSLLLANLGNPLLATTLIFAIAAIKAALVALFYMRLKWEPGYVFAIISTGLAVVLILFFALVPDIIYVYGD
ncbi:MAG: cytochrome C oxidase subunit IV family protein [Deltaproteobacteria bacterium]|nr:cytochrome C oxidase subunit IV family protein [Deltaproteobacteria bacterium]MBI4373404.1 cytochrome C oxidase subunit IV family protein [Deltaproteobacteria bacterium]